MTNVEDTRTTIKQGNNIRMLTLITIAYLPLSYVTVRLYDLSHWHILTDTRPQSLFTVPADKWSFPDHDGIWRYFVLLFPLLFATFVVAFRLDYFFRKAKILGSATSKVQKKWSKGWKKIKQDFVLSLRGSVAQDPV